VIKGVRAILGDDATATNGKSPVDEPVIPPNFFADMTTVEATKTFLEMSRSKKTTAEIVEALRRGGLTPASTNSVYVILFKAMKNKGAFVRDRQRWGLGKKITSAGGDIHED
jgi:hypothetical protein